MSSVVRDERVLTDEEHAAWDDLMDRVDLDLRYEMARAMFADVRPEAFLAETVTKEPGTDDPWGGWDSA